MDLNYSPEDRAFRAEVRRWLEANVPKDELTTLEARKAWHRRLYEAGYVGMLWPKADGGWGAPPMQQAIVADERGRTGGPTGRPDPRRGHPPRPPRPEGRNAQGHRFLSAAHATSLLRGVASPADHRPRALQ